MPDRTSKKASGPSPGGFPTDDIGPSKVTRLRLGVPIRRGHRGEPLMLERFPMPIMACDLPIPLDPIFVYRETLQSHWPPGVDLVRADPNLGSKAKPHAIRHPRGRVPEHAGAIDAVLESLGYFLRRGEDGVCVF